MEYEDFEIKPEHNASVRTLINRLGQSVEVELPEVHWQYFDWLADTDEDMIAWVKRVDAIRRHHGEKLTMTQQMVANLQYDERKRYLTGKTCPLIISPEGYQQDDYLGSSVEEGYAPVGRMLENGRGQLENAVVHQEHWDYYDWLVEQGQDVVPWVKDFDKKRPPEKAFGEWLIMLLWLDMCTNYRDGKPLPFKGEPPGYDDFLLANSKPKS
ncbi:hypothetical protein [Pseudaestuariivita rosea]|uniref:hypothetical protein n=1 Tax=Pseudaestuariivita rosea TaxID=2763263 RepID=UPI001ABA90A4|nr:hypothetical protein [Pseudaestuariivita rosea]